MGKAGRAFQAERTACAKRLRGVKPHGMCLELQKPQDGRSYHKVSEELDNRDGETLRGLNLSLSPSR